MNDRCLFISDFHGHRDRFDTLKTLILEIRPDFVFLGGDILPGGSLLRSMPDPLHEDFTGGYLVPLFERIRTELGEHYPQVFIILGNDDPRTAEASVLDGASRGIWTYLHGRSFSRNGYTFFGCSYVPPTPFMLKDWERFDVSRFTDVGCTPPNEGIRTIPVSEDEITYGTIQSELNRMTAGQDVSEAVFLFHAPPYKSSLDRAALDGQFVDHTPLDCHVGSIAIRRFIEERQPLITLHGHIHESTRLTGSWRERIGSTWCLQGAHDGPETAAIFFSLTDPASAVRILR